MTVLARVDDLHRHFGATRAVDGVSLSIEEGEVVGLLGANGAGKTTLIRVLLGLLAPTSGQVELLGAAPSTATRAGLGYVPQGLGLYRDLTVAENLAFQAAAFATAPADLPDDLAGVADIEVGDLSLGLRRRTAFVAALAHDPRLLVLDEPTSGVGPLGRADLWDTIHAAADSGTGVLVTTHYMDEAEQCDRLVILAAGRQVAAGTVDDVVADRTVVEVSTPDPAGALEVLEGAGLVVLPAGGRLRVVGVDPARVREVLVDQTDVDLRTVPAQLEEAFMEAVAMETVGATREGV